VAEGKAIGSASRNDQAVIVQVGYVYKGEPHAFELVVAKPTTHGGSIWYTAQGALELQADRAGRFRLWLTDPANQLRPITGVTAVVVVDIPGYPEVLLKPEGEHLGGVGPPIETSSLRARAIVGPEAPSETGLFRIDSLR
jgi:hypothetical protein